MNPCGHLEIMLYIPRWNRGTWSEPGRYWVGHVFSQLMHRKRKNYFATDFKANDTTVWKCALAPFVTGLVYTYMYRLPWACGEGTSSICWKWQSVCFCFFSPTLLPLKCLFSPLSTLLHCIFSCLAPSNSYSVFFYVVCVCVFRFCCRDTKPHHCLTHTHIRMIHNLLKLYMQRCK